jgi:hypothetical protein
VEYFSAVKNNAFSDHVYHANHHKFTIKTPRFDTTFSSTYQKTPVKPQKTGLTGVSTFSGTNLQKLTHFSGRNNISKDGKPAHSNTPVAEVADTAAASEDPHQPAHPPPADPTQLETPS